MTSYIFPGIPSIQKSMYVNGKAPFIIETVCQFLKVSPVKVKDRSRKTQLVTARQICMYFLLKKTRLTLKSIGYMFDRDHSTVIHARHTVEDRSETDKKYRKNLQKISELLS